MEPGPKPITTGDSFGGRPIAGAGDVKSSGGPRFGSAALPRFGGKWAIAADQRGAAVIEYALICALLVLALVTGIAELGKSSGSNWTEVSESLPGADTGTGGSQDNGQAKGKDKDKKDKKDK